jgi:hypothetical protein
MLLLALSAPCRPTMHPPPVTCHDFNAFSNVTYRVYHLFYCRPRAALEPFVLLLAPYAPHLAEELWARLGHSSSLAYEPWPEADESLLVVDTINLPVQVGGACYLIHAVCML